MSREDESDIDALRSKLDEVVKRLAEVEEAPQRERQSVRLQVLEAKEEVQERTERTLDEIRAEKERIHKEFT
jgi:vacuolar-type H+-ATPase subunit I/STV1